jgi:hypothetical protein
MTLLWSIIDDKATVLSHLDKAYVVRHTSADHQLMSNVAAYSLRIIGAEGKAMKNRFRALEHPPAQGKSLRNMRACCAVTRVGTKLVTHAPA